MKTVGPKLNETARFTKGENRFFPKLSNGGKESPQLYLERRIEMKRNSVVLSTLVAGFALISAVLVSAQQPASPRGPDGTQSLSSSMMSMGKMMKQCQQNCKAGAAVMNQISQMMSKLRENASDPAKVRADLDEMQKQMKSISGNMSMCMNMMNMQGGMMDSSGGRMGLMMCGRNK